FRVGQAVFQPNERRCVSKASTADTSCVVSDVAPEDGPKRRTTDLVPGPAVCVMSHRGARGPAVGSTEHPRGTPDGRRSESGRAPSCPAYPVEQASDGIGVVEPVGGGGLVGINL